MPQHETQRRSLIERLEALAEAHGQEIAQSYIASGDPEGEPLNLTFSEFVAQTRRRANALCALGGARASRRIRRAAVGNILPDDGGDDGGGDIRADKLFPRNRCAGAHYSRERSEDPPVSSPL